MTNFEKWDKEFRNQNLFAFNFDNNALMWLKVRAICRSKQQLYTLTEKLSELGENEILDELRAKRKEVLNDAQSNTVELMTWLYTNQGEMRFGAENRLFVILVDSTDISQSWKMKRAFALIEPKITQYLDDFNEKSLKEINFKFKGNHYKSLADVIFVVKK